MGRLTVYGLNSNPVPTVRKHKRQRKTDVAGPAHNTDIW
jgi:hypothetical protein